MAIAVTKCRNCSTLWDVALENMEHHQRCPRCRKVNHIYAFPALWTGGAAGSAGERALLDDESTCFYHPEKKASVVCEGCGRFLCGLCDVPFKGKHLCTGCIERGTGSEQDPFRGEHTRYDNVAVMLAVVPMVFPLLLYFTIFTAPVALFLCVRHWRTPLSVVPVNRWRYVVAACFALLQLTVWGVLAAGMAGAFVFYD